VAPATDTEGSESEEQAFMGTTAQPMSNTSTRGTLGNRECFGKTPPESVDT
jgi:hypothetical protein